MSSVDQRLQRLTPKQRQALERKLRQRRQAAEPSLNRIPRRPVVEGGDELSFAQQRLWFVDRLQPGSAAYNIHGALRLTGPLSPPALEWSLRCLVLRHEVLRSQFFASQGEPRVRTREVPPFVLPVVDLTSLATGLPMNQPVDQAVDQARLKGESLVEAEAARPFDLETDPLYRFRLLRESSSAWILVITLHHIVADDWSMQLFTQELRSLYSDALGGSRKEPAAGSLQYADVAHWQRRRMEAGNFSEHLDYWRQKLSGDLPTVDLAPGRQRAEQTTCERVTRSLPAPLSEGVRELGQRHGTTSFITLLALFQGWLYHLTHQEDLLVGTTVANRNHPDLEDLMGFFVNVLPLRTDLRGNPTLSELLGRTRETVLGAFTHQELPFDRMVAEVQPDRDLGRFPLVEVGFELAQGDDEDLGFAGLEVEPLEADDRTARCDLLLQVIEAPEGLECHADFRPERLEREQVEIFLARFQDLVAAAVADAEQHLKLLPLMRREMAAAQGIDEGRMGRLAPLTGTQRDLYLGHCFAPRASTFILGSSMYFGDDLDPDLWQRAVEWVVAEEDILRTRLLTFRDQVYQWVDRKAPVDFAIVPAPHRPTDHPEFLRFVEGLIKQPMEILAPTLVRHRLVRDVDGGWTAVMAIHHLLFDGLACNVFHQRVSSAYEDLATGREPQREALASFYDFVGDNLAVVDSQEIEAFWRPRLANVVPLENLRPKTGGSEIHLHLKSLRRDQEASLRQFCQRTGCALPTLFLTAFGALLSRLYRPEGDFSVASFSTGRPKEHRDTLGCFYEVFPVVFPESLNRLGSSIAEWVELARGYRRSLGEMQHISLFLQNRILGAGGLKFYFNYYRFGHLDALGAKRALVDHNSYSSDEVHLIVREMADQVECKLYFSPDQLVDGGFLDRLLSCCQQISEGALRLGDLDLLSPAERSQLLALGSAPPLVRETEGANLLETGASRPSAPAGSSLVELLAAQAARNPTAVAASQGLRRCTYRELQEASDHLAHRLLAEGVTTDVPVAVLGPRGIDFLVAILAVFKAGGAYVPLDPNYPPRRWRAVIEQAGCPVVLVSKASREPLAQAWEELALDSPGLPESRDSRVQLIPLEEPVLSIPASASTPQDLPGKAAGSELAYVIFTSGSTGKPKGVMVNHQGMLNHLWIKVEDLGLQAGDIVAQTASTCFDISVWQFLAPLMVGARVEIFEDEVAFDGSRLLRAAEQREVTVLETVPSLLQAALESEGDRDLPILRWLLVTGEAVPPGLCRSWLERFPKISIVNAYGPTECSDDVTHEVIDHAPPPEARTVPIGKPLANLRLSVLNPWLQPVPPRLPGELFVGGIGVGRGYLEDPRQTALAFVPDPLSDQPGERLYRTGDRVHLDAQGRLEFQGRLDHQVKVRGFRIELGEVEASVGRLKGVAQAAAAVHRGKGGSADTRLIGYVVAEPGVSLSPSQLKTELARDLPGHLVPSQWVELESLPLTANGKLDRKALSPPLDALGDGTLRVPPRDEIERQVLEIWQELLEVGEIGVEDSFFDLGGQSLLAVRLLARIKLRLGRDLPLATLFAGPTVEALAEVLRQDEPSLPPVPLVAMQPRGEGRPLFCVHPGSGNILGYLALAKALGIGRPVYGLRDPVLWGEWRHGVSVVAMAARYVEEIRRIQPEGPYLLLGWSFGGQIAFEMTAQLEGAGESVDLLAILDTAAASQVEAFAEAATDESYLVAIAQEWGAELEVEDLEGLDDQERLARTEAAMLTTASGEDLGPSWVADRLELFKSRIEVLRNYRPGQVAAGIDLFLAEESDDEPPEADDSTLGWRSHTATDARVHRVPGSHATMADEPHVQTLARKLQERIAARGKSPASP